MKIQHQLLAIASSALLFLGISSALADGTEILGPPGVAIASGTDVVVAGVGLADAPNSGQIDINVPAGSIQQVLLYWEGQSFGPVGDDTIVVDGNGVNGLAIGGPTNFFGDVYSTTYRADITALGLISNGSNSVSVEGLAFTKANNGAGILVILDDGVSPLVAIDIRDGNDLAYIGFGGQLKTTVTQPFMFAPSSVDRQANLSMFFSSVQGPISGGTTASRSSIIEVFVGSNPIPTRFVNQLFSSDGDEWDTLKETIPIPAGVGMITVQAISGDDDLSGNQPASLAWNTAAFSIPTFGGYGCTPGYWKQTQHFDSWTAPYDPDDAFASVFEDAFPGMTLLEVLGQGGGGLQALGRHTVAALLNAASPDVDYDFTVQQVINQFNAVFPGGDYENLKDSFAEFNEQGCPLN